MLGKLHLKMTRIHPLHLPAIALVAMCVSCGPDRETTEKDPADSNLPVTQISADEPTLPLGDIELSLDVTGRDARGLPKEIRITFRNRSAKRGCLALPRPVVEDEDYDASLPCLMVGMRETGDNDPHPSEPGYLDTKPRGQSAGPREGVYLDPGAQMVRRYDLASFCMIGHGIGPKPAANFSTCHQPGNERRELRAYLVADWNGLTRIESNPVEVRMSEVDSSVIEKLYNQ
jgi:hypothetical protein